MVDLVLIRVDAWKSVADSYAAFPGAAGLRSTSATFLRSSTNYLISSCGVSSSGARRIDDGSFKVTQHRGEFVPSELAHYVTATVHPASLPSQPRRGGRQ
jgi:hypothetical protein